jgi:hypothetical protein
MGRKRYPPEQIIGIRRQTKMALARAGSLPELWIAAEAVEKGICPVISVQFPSSSIQPKIIYNQL